MYFGNMSISYQLNSFMRRIKNMYYICKMNDIKKLLGKRIKELRKKQGLSQFQLAEKAKIDQRSLSHIECGDTFPSKALLDLAGALNVDVCDLFDFNHFEINEKSMIEYIKTNIACLSSENIASVYRMVRILR